MLPCNVWNHKSCISWIHDSWVPEEECYHNALRSIFSDSSSLHISIKSPRQRKLWLWQWGHFCYLFNTSITWFMYTQTISEVNSLSKGTSSCQVEYYGSNEYSGSISEAAKTFFRKHMFLLSWPLVKISKAEIPRLICTLQVKFPECLTTIVGNLL